MARRGRGWCAALALAVAACGDDDRPPARPPAAAPAPPVVATATVHAVQLGTYRDSLAAARVALALADSGWTPTVHPAPVGSSAQWRVYVAPAAGDSALPELMAAGIRVTGGEALVVRDTFPATATAGAARVGAVSVNEGSPGLTAGTRWALSPDRTVIVAAETPIRFGRGSPAPGGFVFASEALDCYVHVDSVRSVTAAPGWERLIYARVGERPVELVVSSDSAPPLTRRTIPGAAVRRAGSARWTTGPTLDPSLPVELTKRGAGADGVRITNVGGWVRVADSVGRGRIVGPGVALAATREGRFVLALAPHQDALRDAPTAQLVVYATGAGRSRAAAECPVVDAAR